MTLSARDSKRLAVIKDKLPRYCIARKRKNYAVVYFSVPERLRPVGWNPIYEVGRTDKHTPAEIIARGNELYESFKLARDPNSAPRITTGSLGWLVARYIKSEHFTNLKPATRKSYMHHLETIKEWSAGSKHAHIRHLQPSTIMEFLNIWKDAPRTRKYYKAVLSKLYQVAIEENVATTNPMRELKLPKSKKKKAPYKVWKLSDIESFAAKADEMNLPNVGTAVIIAWEAFRQTDVFELQEPRDYRNGGFAFETSKTGEPISVLASQRTVMRLASRPRTQLLLTVNDRTHKPWTKDAFHKQFRKVADACGLGGYVFRRIRNSSAIHALKANLTDAEFQQRYGWSKADVKLMRDHYTDIDQEIIDSGAKKLARLDKKRSTRSLNP